MYTIGSLTSRLRFWSLVGRNVRLPHEPHTSALIARPKVPKKNMGREFEYYPLRPLRCFPSIPCHAIGRSPHQAEDPKLRLHMRSQTFCHDRGGGHEDAGFVHTQPRTTLEDV